MKEMTLCGLINLIPIDEEPFKTQLRSSFTSISEKDFQKIRKVWIFITECCYGDCDRVKGIWLYDLCYVCLSIIK